MQRLSRSGPGDPKLRPLNSFPACRSHSSGRTRRWTFRSWHYSALLPWGLAFAAGARLFVMGDEVILEAQW